MLEMASKKGNAVEAVGEGSLVEEKLGPDARGSIATKGAQLRVEQLGHGVLVRWATVGDKTPWWWRSSAG